MGKDGNRWGKMQKDTKRCKKMGKDGKRYEKIAKDGGCVENAVFHVMLQTCACSLTAGSLT